MKRDDDYQKNFQQNTNRISRDQYVERKVKLYWSLSLPTVTFYSSVYYSIVEDGEEKNRNWTYWDYLIRLLSLLK